VSTTTELPPGFYRLPRVNRLNALLNTVGYQAEVVCVSLEADLNFRRRDTSPAHRLRLRRNFHALCQTLRCIDQLSGGPLLVLPGFVAEPGDLTDSQLVQTARSVGYLNDHTNSNPPSLGLVMVDTHLKGVAMGQPIADAPGKYYVYVDLAGDRPFILTGTCLDVWHRLPHGLQSKQIDLIRREVQKAGRTFSVKKLWVFISPGGRNDGCSISQAGYDMLKAAGPEYAFYLYEGHGLTPEKPHGLDLTGLSYRQAILAGIPESQIGGLHGESTFSRTPLGEQKWGSKQSQGEEFVSGIIAGVVRPISG
jgi:hypothetical protein